MTGVAPEDGAAAMPPTAPADASHIAGEDAGRATYVPSEGSVAIAYLHGSRVSHSWHQSLMTAIAYDKSVGLNLIGHQPFAVSCSGPTSLVEGRNLAVSNFLDKTEAEWLLFIDTDMGFQADAIEQLLLAAHPVERPVVGGLCFAMKQMAADGKGGFNVRPVPTLFMFARNEQQGFGFANRFRYPPETLVQVAGTGAAFVVIHRSILEQIRVKDGPIWYNLVTYGDGTQVSEDLSFCWRVAQLKRPIFVHTGVKITHHKEIWLDERDYVMPDIEPMAQMMKAADATGGPPQ